MKVKFVLTDDDGNVLAISHYETDVVDANGDIMTTEALMHAIEKHSSITWIHTNAPIEERHTRQS